MSTWPLCVVVPVCTSNTTRSSLSGQDCIMLTVATSSPCSSGWLRICLTSLAFSVSFSSSALASACRSASCCSQAINQPDLSIYWPRQVSERSFVQLKKQTHTQEPIEWKVKRVRLNFSQWRHREMASTCFLSPTTNFFIICKENLCTPKLWKTNWDQPISPLIALL